MVQKEHNYKFITPCGLPTLYRGIDMCLQAEIPLNLQTSGRCWFKSQKALVEYQCLTCSAESREPFANLLWGEMFYQYQSGMNVDNFPMLSI